MLRQAGDLAETGLRTLLLASGEHLPGDGKLEQLPAALRPVALLTFREQPRSDARETLEFFRSEGVRLKIISGDDPRTVAAIARRVGLEVTSGLRCTIASGGPAAAGGGDGGQRGVWPGDAGPEAADGRGAPTPGPHRGNDRRRRQRRLGPEDGGPWHRHGLRLTRNEGRGAPGVARRPFRPASGVLAEGRQVIANIERSPSLFLSKTVYAIAIAVTFGLLQWEFPFLPRQLSFTDGLTIGIPAFFLALMPNPRRYQPGFLRRSLWFSVPAGLIVTASLLTLNAIAPLAGTATPEQVSSASVLTLSLVGLWILSAVSRPLNAGRLAVLVAMCASLLILLNLPLAQEFFLLRGHQTGCCWRPWRAGPPEASESRSWPGSMPGSSRPRRAPGRRRGPVACGGPIRPVAV